MSWTEGVDISYWQGGYTRAQWRKLYDLGQRVACVGSAHPRPNTFCESDLANAYEEGFTLATYVVVYPGYLGKQVVKIGEAQCGKMWPKVVWVGVDAEVDGVTEQMIRDAGGTLDALGKRKAIYTAAWWWVDHFNNSQAFKDWPLWAANYRSKPDPEHIPLFGGWTRDKLIGHQYQGTVSLGGLTVDRNVFRDDFTFLVPEPVPLPPNIGVEAMSGAFIIVDPKNGTGYWFTNGFVRRRSDSPEERKTWAKAFGIPETPAFIDAKFLMELPEVKTP